MGQNANQDVLPEADLHDDDSDSDWEEPPAHWRNPRFVPRQAGQPRQARGRQIPPPVIAGGGARLGPRADPDQNRANMRRNVAREVADEARNGAVNLD